MHHKREERQTDVANSLNENIFKSEKLLQDYLEAQADYHEDLERQFADVIEEKETLVDTLTEQLKLCSRRAAQ